MDFFESQDRARRQTFWLVVLYFLAVSMIVGAIYLAFVIIFVPGGGERGANLWHAETFLGVAGITLVVIVLAALFRIGQLRRGGPAVAEMLGGRQVNPSTIDPDERRLLNVVEEMAIASGVPVPEVFVLDEKGINAFAAGHTPSNAAVAVTRGCLETLNRDELQGVIAHEFSHILNGDMRLNIRLIGILNGILVIYLLGRIVLSTLRYSALSAGRRTGGRGGRGGGGGDARVVLAILAFAFAMMIIGFIGVFFSRLIQSAISRQREYLADAAAVQFTRNPEGIGNALRKIGGASLGSRMEASHAQETSHLFFADGVRSFGSAFSTHPPLAKRIRAIDPSFDGKSWIVPKKRRAKKDTPPPPPKKAPSSGKGIPVPGMEAITIPPEAILAAVGTLGEKNISRAEHLLRQIPDSLRESAHEQLGAEAILYALLLSGDSEIRNKQLTLLKDRTDQRLFGEITDAAPAINELPPACRLPLIDLGIPALRQLSPTQYESFRDNIARLIAADENVSLFEFTLEKVLLRHLDAHFKERPNRPAQIYSARGLRREFSVILSAFARTGEKNTKKAFSAGVARLGRKAPRLAILPATETGIEQLDQAITRMERAALPVKKQLLAAAIHTVASDGKVAPDEAEMLRALADSLDCPMPPLG